MTIVLMPPGVCEFQGSVWLWDGGSSGNVWQGVSSLAGFFPPVTGLSSVAMQVLPESPGEFSYNGN